MTALGPAVRSLVLRLLPRPWRDRYGDELLELLVRSDRPLRDAADVARLAVSLRLEGLTAGRGRDAFMQGYLKVGSLLLVGVGLLGAAWSSAELGGGVRDIPGHWWSSLAVLPALAGVALAALAWRPALHRSSR